MGNWLLGVVGNLAASLVVWLPHHLSIKKELREIRSQNSEHARNQDA